MRNTQWLRPIAESASRVYPSFCLRRVPVRGMMDSLEVPKPGEKDESFNPLKSAIKAASKQVGMEEPPPPPPEEVVTYNQPPPKKIKKGKKKKQKRQK